ncbi:MAG: RluA family pseudouridine synthase [Candidatus Binatia bacterium]
MTRHRIHVAQGRAERVDRLLAASIAGVSRRGIQQMLSQRLVRIDGRAARKGEMIYGERILEVEVLAPLAAAIVAEAEPAVPLLVEDPSWVALDKPARRPSHALRASDRGTIANFIAARFPECISVGDSPLEAGLVHRLDTGTSGVIVAARSRETWLALRRQFREGTIEKRYFAVVSGALAGPGVIDRPIAPHPRSRRKVQVLGEGDRNPGARTAITRYSPLAARRGMTLLEVEIPTGRMHQIRAHLAAIGHPVIGDVVYGEQAIAEGRHLLHAARLGFDHPRDSRRVIVESPPPADFVRALRRLGLRLPSD